MRFFYRRLASGTHVGVNPSIGRSNYLRDNTLVLMFFLSRIFSASIVNFLELLLLTPRASLSSFPFFVNSVLERIPAPHLYARQEQLVVQIWGCLTYIGSRTLGSGTSSSAWVSRLWRWCLRFMRKVMVVDREVIPEGVSSNQQHRNVILRTDHPSLASGTGGKSLASLRQSLPEGSLTLGTSSPADIPTHVTELKRNFKVKYDARGVLLREKDDEIARLKSLLEEKETESAEVLRLRDQVFPFWMSCLDDSQVPVVRPGALIYSFRSERDGLASEVSTLHSAFSDFKEKMEEQGRAATCIVQSCGRLEAHVMDVSGLLEEEFYPAYLTTLAGRRWLLTYGMELAMVKCLKSPRVQGIWVCFRRAVEYGMQEGFATALERGGFSLGFILLKSKKDSGMA
ncbi:hypothetical protein Tco_0409999 [Tanacetum coccineum]